MFLACSGAALQSSMAAKLYEEERRKKWAAANADTPKRKQGWFKPGSPEALAAEAAKMNSSTNTEATSDLGSSTRSSKSSDSFNKVKVQDRDMYWMMNQERQERKMKPLRKIPMLEGLAQNLANELSLEKPLTPTEYYGNVGCGRSLKHVHQTIMSEYNGVSRENILNEDFTECGVGKADGPDGQIFTVTLFN